MSILLFSRPIRSGKTTEIEDWISNKIGVGGVLMPDVEGFRLIKSLRSGESMQAQILTADYLEDSVIKIGSFVFSKAAFSFGKSVLIKELELLPEVLIIDEIGKLELKGLGFYDELQLAIPTYSDISTHKTLLLVVREELLSEIIAQFRINNFKVIHTLEELK